MVHKWHNLGIVSKHEENIQGNSGLLPKVAWIESGRPLPKNDPSFDQVEYAEETILKATKLDESKTESNTRSLRKTNKPKLNRTATSHVTYGRDEK